MASEWAPRKGRGDSASDVHHESGTEEMRARAILHMAAGTLMVGRDRPPEPERVAALAKDLRRRLHRAAEEAQQALGDMPEWTCQAKADLRVYSHDLLFRDHDKDYRMYVAFPVEELADRALATVRVGNAVRAGLRGYPAWSPLPAPRR